MKITLQIEADSEEQLRAACRAIAGDAPVVKAASTPTAPVAVNEDPYGDGNGPVDAVPDTKVNDDPHPGPEVEGVELDQRGVPWHGEFHTSTKRQTADGAWAKKRGHDAEALAAYEAQFIDASPFQMTPQRPAEPDKPAPTAEATAPQQTAEPDKPAPTAELDKPAPTAEAVLKAVSVLISNGTKTPVYLNELAKAAGLNAIAEMFGDADAIARVAEAARADGVDI